MRLLLLFTVLGGLGSSAAAQSVPEPARLTFSPASPNYAGLDVAAFAMRFYPAPAVEAAQSGSAVLECEAGPASRPVNCTVVEETPGGFYFGAASLRMVPQFIVSGSDGRTLREGERFRYKFVLRPG